MMELERFLQLSINWILISTSIGLFAWYYLKDKLNYWNRRGVFSLSPTKSFIQFVKLTFGQEHFMHGIDRQYKEFDGHKYVGSYQLTLPSLFVRDPEVIKEILIKHFSSFHDRLPTSDAESDQFSDGNLTRLNGEKWRQVRHKVSPAFSAAKMKIMYETLKDCAQQLNNHLLTLCSQTGKTEIEVRELMSNYTMDVIGACAMGIKCDAIRDPNCEFKKVVENMFKFDLRRSTYMFLELIHPKLPGLFGLKSMDSAVEMFFRAACKETMKTKAKDVSSSRKDFLQILMSIRSSEVEKMSESTRDPVGEVELSEDSTGPIFTENVIVGVTSIFISAGLEPVASTLTFCLYELALRPDIQDKIFNEIQNVKKETGNDISYEDLKKFQYIEQVINETLRKYPVAVNLVRQCTDSFALPDSAVVEKGVRVIIPAYSIQHDPKYFPEPEKFLPERFSEENIDKIVPGTYLPFGDGPRFCIGMRLALMDIKTMLITLVSNYTLHTCDKTQKHIEFDRNVFTLSPKGGLYLQLQKRK